MSDVSLLSPMMSTITSSIKTSSELVEKYQTQLSTNQKETNYSGLSDKISVYTTLESFIKSKEAEIDNALFVAPDLSIIQNVTQSIRKHAEEFSSLAGQAVRNEMVGFDYQKSAKSTLTFIQDLLNTKSSERYLCAGSVVNEKPVDLSLLPNPATYNLDDTDDIPIDPNNPQSKPSYYKGDNNLSTLQIDNQHFDISFTANELGPQRFIRALHILSTADPNAANYKTKLGEVFRVSQLAVNDLRNIETKLAATSEYIKTAQTNIASQNLDFEKKRQDINAVNQNESAIKAMSALNLLNVNNQIAAQIMSTTEKTCNMFLAGA